MKYPIPDSRFGCAWSKVYLLIIKRANCNYASFVDAANDTILPDLRHCWVNVVSLYCRSNENQVEVMADQDDFLAEHKCSVCASQQGTGAGTLISYLSTSQLDVNKTTSSSKKQPQSHRNNASCNRKRHRRIDREGGASSQLAAPPKQV